MVDSKKNTNVIICVCEIAAMQAQPKWECYSLKQRHCMYFCVNTTWGKFILFYKSSMKILKLKV